MLEKLTLIKFSKKVRNVKNKIISIDCETKGLKATPESFLFGCAFWFEKDKECFKIFYNVSDFKDFILNSHITRNKYICGHNIEYDLLTIFGAKYLLEKNIFKTVIHSGSRFVYAETCDKHKRKFFDTMNIFNTSLKDVGQMIGIEKMEISEHIKKSDNETITEYDIEYCLNDCRITHAAACWFFEKIGRFTFTQGAAALFYFRSKYLKKTITYIKDYTNIYFNSYYGGRCEVFKAGKCTAEVYDINSMYPFSMLQPFPKTDCYYYETNLSNKKHIENIINNFEGIAEIELFHKPFKIGLLPVRDENGLIFPTNQNIKGFYNLNELRFAMQKGAIEILKVNEIYYSEPNESIFKEYILDNYNKRKEAKTSIEKNFYKILLNALYGKFGERERFLNIYFSDILELNAFLETNNYKDFEVTHIKKSDIYNVKFPKGQPKHSIPLFSSYVTSHARILLNSYILKIFEMGYNVLYCDTDSVFIEGKDINIFPNSNELGRMKKENKIIIEIINKKWYKYLDENGKLCETMKHGKNAQLVDNETVVRERLVKTKEGLRRGLIAGTPIKETRKVKKLI